MALVPAAREDDGEEEEKEDRQPYLVIGIPTVPRVKNEDHLLRVLASILDQLPTEAAHPLYGRVRVLVMNCMHDGPHERFEQAKKYLQGPHRAHLEFVQEPAPLPDKGGESRGNANRPGPRVRKQTRNIASVVRAAAHKGKYFLFMEDDMLLCAQAVRASLYLLDRANEYSSGKWIAVRASFGMNGIFMQGGDDLDVFADYLVEHQSRRPPDHLVVEYFAGETRQSARIKANRPHFGFRYNLCDHLGAHSTLRSEMAKQMPICYEELTFPAVFDIEAFKPKQCPEDDLTPCPKKPREPRIHFGEGWPKPKLQNKKKR